MFEPEIYNGTAAADAMSVPVQIDDLTAYSVQITFSGGAGDLAGVLTVEASNDAVTFVTVAGSAQTVVASTNHVYNVSDASYRWFRIVWDYTSGTGNMVMKAVIKQPVNRF